MLKLAVIGTHTITNQMLTAIADSQQYQLTTVYSRNRDRAEKFGQPWGATAFYDDLDAFFSEGDFDVVYIASPNSLHFKQASLAIANDKFVIVEKPAFVNPTEFDQIESLLHAHPKARLVEASRHLYTDVYAAGKRALQKMGKLKGANLTSMKYSSRYDQLMTPGAPVPNVFSPDFAGGALMDMGYYAVSVAVDLFGLPHSVVYAPIMSDSGVDLRGTGLLTYDDALVTINTGKDNNSFLPSEIYGEGQTVVFDGLENMTKVSQYDRDKQGTVLASVPADSDRMAPEMATFADWFSHPDGQEQAAAYQHALDRSRMINTVIYDLRQSADLVFPEDKQE